METKINLRPSGFTDKERIIVESGSLTASAFIYESGVCGIRLKNEKGELVLLPFQGQQVWSAEFCGRNLTMRTLTEQPLPTRNFLESFGAFINHCGLDGVGGPSKEDTHALHGDLPNAPYQKAWIITGEDAKGKYIGMSGEYRHLPFFSANYAAEPAVKLYSNSTVFTTTMKFTNLKKTAMEYCYLAHVNFRAMDNGRLVYSAIANPENVRVRASIPSHIKPGPGYVEFIESLKTKPELHHVLKPELSFDPEAVLFINFNTDEEGRAHSMQVHPDGTADYISHKPSQLPKATRWISRTKDQDCLAIVEPATSEPEGYLAEKKKGNVKVLQPGETFFCEMEMGFLDAKQAVVMEKKIAAIVERSKK